MLAPRSESSIRNASASPSVPPKRSTLIELSAAASLLPAG
jgi:hypothetical protein